MKQQTLINLLKELQALPRECEWVEFKLNNSNPHDIGEYLSALSNGACYNDQQRGFLVFGIEDGTHRLVGTDFNPYDTKIGNHELENWLAVHLNPRIDFNIFQFETEGQNVVIFKIDAARSHPVGFKNIEYIRIGSYTKPLKEHPERERKIWQKTDKIIFEKEIALENVEKDTVFQLIDHSSFYQLLNYPETDNQSSILSKLTESHIIERVNDKKYNITNLGAILFARELRNFENLERKGIRLIIYQGNDRIKTTKESTGHIGYAVGFTPLIKYIRDRLPTSEIIENSTRKQIDTYPAIVIRELVANAIIHQDFNVKGSSPMIEVFSDRVEITNPGKPLIDPLRFLDHSPESRNEKLAKFMRDLNFCEERGSGIDKVVFECENYKLPSPEFIVGDNYTRAIIYAPKTLRQLTKEDKIRSCYLHACLKYVKSESMTNQSLRERFGIEEKNYPQVSRIISEAKEAGMIKDYDPENKSKTHAKYLPFWG